IIAEEDLFPYAFPAVRRRGQWSLGGFRWLGRRGRKRKVNDKGRALTGFAAHGDAAAVLFDDAIAKAQAQACAFADVFGREKGIEYFGEVRFRDSGSIVL